MLLKFVNKIIPIFESIIRNGFVNVIVFLLNWPWCKRAIINLSGANIIQGATRKYIIKTNEK